MTPAWNVFGDLALRATMQSTSQAAFGGDIESLNLLQVRPDSLKSVISARVGETAGGVSGVRKATAHGGSGPNPRPSGAKKAGLVGGAEAREKSQPDQIVSRDRRETVVGVHAMRSGTE